MAETHPAAFIGVLVLRVERGTDGRFRATLAWTHDVETWPVSASRRRVALRQVSDAVRDFLLPYGA